VLGNGTLALILDVAATGARAGVRQVAEVLNLVSASKTQAETAQIEMESSMVIYESGKRGSADGGSGEQMGMPLSAVERIESVPLSEIEYADGRAVLQYRGELIPLEDEDDVLRERSAQDGSATVTVLMCLRPEAQGARRVGMVVRRVLDVSPGTLLAADAAACKQQLAMVKNRVTTVHREFALRVDGTPAAALREVA
jgi:two-component system chemotaxis sensor kinase CheA